jgi:hypothetical protein
MKMTPRLQQAVREARRIRGNLVRWRRCVDLGGDCAIASLMLAAAIDDVSSLRHHDLSFRSWSPHVWNVVDGVIVDVTATQFNDLDEYQPFVRGVLVTRKPHIFHSCVTSRGAVTLEYLKGIGEAWYDDDDEQRRFRRALVRLGLGA